MPQKPDLSTLGEQLFAELYAQGNLSPAPTLRVTDEIAGALGTHLGQKRKRNEDRIVVALAANPFGFAYKIAVVCDGVGGSARGDEAAAIACASVISRVAATTSYLRPSDLLRTVILDADDAVRNLLGGQGTTTISVYLGSDRNEFALTNVGDSRIYSWSPGAGIIQLSIDDTLENELRQLDVKSPTVLDERGLRGSLSQALGESGRTSADLNLKVLNKTQVPPGGLILATDGIWKGNEAAFSEVVDNCRSSLDVVRRCLTLASWLGGLDNASIIVLDESELSEQTRRTGSPSSVQITVWTPNTKLLLLTAENKTSFSQETSTTSKQRPDPKTQTPKPKKRKRAQKNRIKQNELALPDDPSKTPEKKQYVIDVGPDEN